MRRLLGRGWWIVGAIGTFLTYLGLFAPEVYRELSETDWLTFIGSDLFRTILVILGLGLISLAMVRGSRRQASQPPVNTLPQAEPKTSVEDPREERVFVGPGVTPEYLFGLYEGKTDMQAQKAADLFLGKWMPISGPLRNIGAWHEAGSYCQVTVELGDAPIFFMKSLYLYFRDKRWVDRLSVLAAGDLISVHGRIDRISRFEIQLQDCELEDPHE
jgi:hypothetical protein